MSGLADDNPEGRYRLAGRLLITDARPTSRATNSKLHDRVHKLLMGLWTPATVIASLNLAVG